MATLLLVLVPIALLDATSITPLCMVPLILLMSGPRALVTSVAFLLGIFVSYVLSMVLVLLGLQSLLDVVTGFFVRMWNHPDTADIWLGIAIGLVMMLFGARLAGSREGGDDRRLGEAPTPASAFAGGVALTVIGLPGALPLFAAVDQILRADPSTAGQLLAILFYNAIFIAPLTAVLLARLVLGDRVEPLLQRISDAMTRWGHRVIVIGLVVVGGVLVADGIGWLLGHPLLPTFPDPGGPASPV